MGILRILNNLVLAGARNLSPSSLFNHPPLLEKKKVEKGGGGGGGIVINFGSV